MIIYNQEGLNNVILFSETTVAYQKGLITEQELLKVKQAYPSPFYTPNLFVRAGFFLLTCIISTFGSGLLTLMFSDLLGRSISSWFLLLSLAHYGTLEFLVRKNHYYRAGVDDALMWISGGLLTGFLIFLIDHLTQDKGLIISAFVFLLATTFTLRFTDLLMAALAYLAAFTFVFFTWQKLGSIGALTLPFTLILFSFCVCWISYRLQSKLSVYYYKNCLIAVRLLSLLTLYLSGNFYVVKELGDMLHGTVNKTIPLAWFFWTWTFALPLVYIGFGISRKSNLLIRTGLLLIAAAAFTFRNYYHVLPVEQALSFAGFFLVAIAWILIRYLHTPKVGFTSKPYFIKSKEDEQNVESLVVSETFSDVGKHTGEVNIFGGGKFGGGGSSGGF